MNPTLKYLNNRSILQEDRLMMTHFLQDYKQYLSPAAAELLARDQGEHRFNQWCDGWAAQFNSILEFGAPLVKALVSIEKLAEPENRPILDEAIAHLPDGFEVNRGYHAVNQAVHLWYLSMHVAGVTWPMKEEGEKASAAEARAETGGGGERRREEEKEEEGKGRGRGRERGGGGGGREEGEAKKAICEGEEGVGRRDQPSPAASARQGGVPTMEEEFERLAKLSAVEYDRARKAEAKRLNPRLRTLDQEVERARSLQDDAQANGVKLPELEPWPEPVTEAPALFDEVYGRYGHYIYMQSHFGVAMALWTGHAHAIRAFVLSPRLNFMSSEPGCGKSTAMDVMATMLPKVLRTDNLKTAVLFRVVDQQQPTLLLDEVDSYLHLFPDLRGLINGGHSVGGCAMRCEGKGVRSFKAYAATALAGIGSLTRTLRDRSIVIHLEKAPPGAQVARFDRRRVEKENELGRKMARWAKDNFEAIAACDPVMPPEAWNRVGDNWRPLFSIAQIVGGTWPQRTTEAFMEFTQHGKSAQGKSVEGATADPGLALLGDVRGIIERSGEPRVFLNVLVESLRQMAGRPWRNGLDDDGVNERWLGHRLAALGVASRRTRVGDRRWMACYLEDVVEAVRQRDQG